MTVKKHFLFFNLFVCPFICAQQNSIALKEVVIADRQLHDFSETKMVFILSDSVIKKNQASLTSLLNYNTAIYFKENGLGMVATPSFRGTTAQQTAVIWNGINTNSQLNGVTDFNTIVPQDFDYIAVRSGGGSAVYGSSAIGGSIHLNNELPFKKSFTNTLNFNYGSFNTVGIHFKTKYATKIVSTQFSFSRNSATNNYPFIDTADRKNENGQFESMSLNFDFGYQLNKSNTIKYYSQLFKSDRHFSLLSLSDTKTKYIASNLRNLVEWNTNFSGFESNVKLAFLSENYQYFENLNQDYTSFGKVTTLVAKHGLLLHLNSKIKLNSVLDFSENRGEGAAISYQKRQIFGFSLFWNQVLSKKIIYEWSIRKEATTNYESPFLYSLGFHFAPFSIITFKCNLSKNFRIPTFNDLYWEVGGNTNLKPESSQQAEFSSIILLNKLRFTTTYYHSKIQDMIRWLPLNSSYFSPINTDQVVVNGFESHLNWSTKSDKKKVSVAANYAFTNSINQETGKQLIYVPYHKWGANLGCSYRNFNFNYDYLYTGFVYTQSDNNPQKKVAWYTVSNFNTACNFGKQKVTTIGFKVLNLLNENYQSVANRPMPGRNFNLYLTLNF